MIERCSNWRRGCYALWFLRYDSESKPQLIHLKDPVHQTKRKYVWEQIEIHNSHDSLFIVRVIMRIDLFTQE